MFAVSGKFSKSVSLEANRVTVLSLAQPSAHPAIVFEVDAELHYSSLEFSPVQPIFALASEESVKVYDATNGNLLFTIAKQNTSSVAFSHASSAKDAATLFVANAVDGTVTEFALLPSNNNGSAGVKELGSFVGDKKGVNCICVNADGLIAAAKNKLYIFDKANEYKCVSKFAGHDSPVVAMRFLENDAELVSCNGKEVFVWPPARKNRKAVSPIYSLKVESREVSQLAVGPPALVKSSTYVASVLAAWPGGEARVWQIPSENMADDNVLFASSNLTGVLAADFAGKDGLLCLPSSACEELVLVPLVAPKSSSSKKLAVRKEIDVLEAAAAAVPVSGSSNGQNGNATTAAAASSQQQRLTRLDHSTSNAAAPASKRVRKDSQVDEEVEDERPMLSRLADFSSRLATQQANAMPHAHSQQQQHQATLSVTLEQALQTEEREKIEAVLQNVDLIQATIAKLHTNKLAALLKELLARFACATSPARYEQLLLWLNSVLEQHGDFLSTSQECKQMLGEIYKVSESRVASFAPLFRLKGKLDFTLARCSKQQGVSASGAGPIVVVDGMSEE